MMFVAEREVPGLWYKLPPSRRDDKLYLGQAGKIQTEKIAGNKIGKQK